jgi:hypothetical protein
VCGGGGRNGKETCPASHVENESRTQNGGPYLLVLHFQRAGGMQMVKDNGSG